MDKSAGDSSLAVTVRGLQDGAERALQFHANYLRKPDGGSIELNKDFDRITMDAPVMTAYAALVAGGFPKRVAVEMLKRAGRVPEDEDVEVLVLEWDAAAQAAADAKQIEAEERAADMQEGAA